MKMACQDEVAAVFLHLLLSVKLVFSANYSEVGCLNGKLLLPSSAPACSSVTSVNNDSSIVDS